MHRPCGSTGNATASEGWRLWAASLCGLALLCASAGQTADAWAQAPAPGSKAIYSCVDERGRRLTADRPIPECNAREQRVLNSDGSLREVRPPTLTPQERDAQEARERKAAQARAAQADAERRDRNLLQRYPDEAAHAKARQAALETVTRAQTISQRRLAELDLERAALLADPGRQTGSAPPAGWQRRLDANEAARLAQLEAGKTQNAEVDRIQRRFDLELQRLQALWQGTPPGAATLSQDAASRPVPAIRKP